MPEGTTLHPAGQRRADAVVAAPVMTQYQALRTRGWIMPVDFMIIGMLGATLVTLLFWEIFATPSAWNVLSCILTACAISQIWIVLLIFRCARFVLEVTGYIHTLPEEAARIAMAAFSGRPLPPKH